MTAIAESLANLKQYYYAMFNPNPEPFVVKGDYAFKIPVYTDTHWVLKEPSNRTRYLTKQISVLYNLDDFATANDMKLQIHAGDAWDRGDPVMNTLYYNHLSNAIHNTFATRLTYIVRGNHEESYSKNNLFYAHTEIVSSALKEKLKQKDMILPNTPYFRATDKISLNINNTGKILDIHFMHFNKEQKYYIPPNENFTVAVFHEDLLTLESKSKIYHHTKGMGIDLETTNIADNVDVIICGHIHTPMEPFRLNNARRTLVIVPGSLCQRTRAETHDHVNIPVICGTPTGEVVIEFARFNLGLIVETMDIEKDTQSVKQRQLQKQIKQKYIDKAEKSKNYQAFLDTLDAEDRKLLTSEGDIMPIAVMKYYTRKY